MALPNADQETTITITDEETCRMAQELADLKGQPLADVITVAIYYQLCLESRHYPETIRGKRALIANPEWDAEIHALIKRFNKDLPSRLSTEECMDDMYDEDGLPI